jgi:DNA-binding transcriptional regulator LsrR (DeoR family)
VNGGVIKTAIKKAKKTQEEVADALDISREHLGRMLKSNVPEAYVQQIKEMGIEIPEVTKSDNQEDDLKGLTPVEMSLIQALNIIRENQEQVKLNNDQWIEANKVLTKLLDKAVDQGIIGVLPKEAREKSKKN